MHGVRDGVIPPQGASYLYRHAGSSQKSWSGGKTAEHGVPFDAEREAVWRKGVGVRANLWLANLEVLLLRGRVVEFAGSRFGERRFQPLFGK